MLEHELRASMAEETASLTAAPDLVDRVVRLSRRRRRTRVGAVLVAAAVALGGFFVVDRETPVAATAYSGELPDVSFGYLPPGLGKPSKCEGTCVAWKGLKVTTFRSGEMEALGTTGPPSFIRDPQRVIVRGRSGFLSADGRDLFWAERDKWAVWVRADDPTQLLAVARGMRFTGVADDVFEGLRIGYLPDAVSLLSPSAPDGWTERRWWGENGAQVHLIAVRGSDATTLDRFLQEWGGRLSGLRREGEAYLATFEGGRARVWLQQRGLVFVLSVHGWIRTEFERIVAGITPFAEFPWPDSVDGVEVHYLPPGLDEKHTQTTELGEGWSAVRQAWTSPPSRAVAVIAYRGAERWLGKVMAGGKDVVLDARTGRREVRRQGDCMVYRGRNDIALVVKVCVSHDLSDQLERIVAQTQPPWR